MIKLSNTKLLSITTKMLILVLIAKSVSLGLMWILPNDGISLELNPNYQPKYQRVDFRYMLEESLKKEQKQKVIVNSSGGISITNMLLKGLYGTENSGFVILALKSSPKNTTILSIGEVYSGYTLKSIKSQSATFLKNGTTFVLQLETTKQSSPAVNIPVRPALLTSEYIEPLTQQVVTRKDIQYYAKNPKQIWKEISIYEVKSKDSKSIKGFKITRIDPKSRFATMGLKKGDLIIKANNIKLTSYRDALNLYTKIDKIDTIQIIVIRNGIEKEIIYDIQ